MSKVSLTKLIARHAIRNAKISYLITNKGISEDSVKSFATEYL